jgi:hypothetical protein
MTAYHTLPDPPADPLYHESEFEHAIGALVGELDGHFVLTTPDHNVLHITPAMFIDLVNTYHPLPQQWAAQQQRIDSVIQSDALALAKYIADRNARKAPR